MARLTRVVVAAVLLFASAAEGQRPQDHAGMWGRLDTIGQIAFLQGVAQTMTLARVHLEDCRCAEQVPEVGAFLVMDISRHDIRVVQRMVSQFYEDPANAQLQWTIAVWHSALRLSGADEEVLAETLRYWRRAAATLPL